MLPKFITSRLPILLPILLESVQRTRTESDAERV